MSGAHANLKQQSVKKVFFQYFFPSLLGMMLMSINILIDGIFVGNGVGAEGLAGVNLAMPVFSLIFSIALWIGIGGGTIYSIYTGGEQLTKARSVFSLAIVSALLLLLIVGVFGYVNVEAIAKLLGANTDTLTHTVEYLKIMFLLGWLIALQQLLSIFVRNDGSPTLSMVALGATAIINIGLNYYMIFVLELGVLGAALATALASFAGLLVLLLHFFKKHSNLRSPSFQWSWKMLGSIFSIGFPSFLAEAGTLVFVAGYNLAVVGLLGTEGVAAFSVVNYLHGFMFLSFFGIESALQPLISFYHGAKEKVRIKESVRIGEKASFTLGGILLLIGLFAAPLLVSLFGLESDEVRKLAVQGIRLFFIGYIFLGFNFVYMTYFQSIGEIRPSIIIILLRSFVFILVLLWLLPKFFGIAGVWLALPIAEMLVALLLFFITRKHVLKHR
ncbi:MAG: MATE family efflux transporter [Bacillota bacterium]|uniref:Multidrug export protein MepA n=1 Tax=Virgibacillus salarius TaxID=447199 RepID=A0A941ICJ8_9BACI|nr:MULTISPECIES: MATE family efflux transporter [Bacillaceae]NAZ10173.1 MATE family efflux transporter [Agaribacter marinus]MBR7797462.1 MATE family efflux transporter [Virgibacillus salarius]MCC2249718.1 MATE family efflux transporter [Virgibacillus sp. AGTR]MDY7042709.1 MATE family efflux transporter [Virgibacillus sp. M23]QRZ17161.1 MATE family efflux transporter [Virgibacillus sp. AGTR]